MAQRDDLIDAYIHDVVTGRDEYFWAWEDVDDLVSNSPEEAWALLLEVIDRCPHRLLYIVGAGPLEDLIVQAHDILAEQIVERLTSSERFRSAFNVARLYELPPATLIRFNAAFKAAVRQP